MLNIILFFAVLITIDIYVFQPVRMLLKNKNEILRKVLYYIYWSIPAVIIIGLPIYAEIEDFQQARIFRYVLMTLFAVNYIPKLFISIILLFGDILSFIRWVIRLLASKKEHKKLHGKPITRSEFLAKASLISAGAPLALMGFGIIRGAHDYRVKRKTLYLKNLPKEFDGIKIGQISDIHTGSFFNKLAVQGGVDMFMAEKPDIVFFTGDLVNNATREVEEYISIFSGVKAPLGVYSVTGNHDYGDYTQWPSEDAKRKNFLELIEAHKLLGYDLLLNENRSIKVDGESIGVLGVENWGAGRFQKYGDLSKAYNGSEEQPFKILLSHDPSHWDAQVRKDYKDIDIMLAGHTHGFQFGVEVGDFKWSPSQYIYKQWAGLYENNDQLLYVNRGFGYLGYPGRIGIPPEITILELKKEV